MPELKNVVAVDWRSGKDRCYFFFKDTNTYTRFDIGNNKVPKGYPKKVKESNWGSFHSHIKNLRFGFTTTGFANDSESGFDDDILWFFYHDNSTPMVCKFDQDLDKPRGFYPVSNTVWASLVPYFDHIIAGIWWEQPGYSQVFRFLMNDGYSLAFDNERKLIQREKIDSETWPGLAPYKDRIITAVQNDRTFADSYLYVFLTDNQYIRYNIRTNRAESEPIDVDDESWPGLLDN